MCYLDINIIGTVCPVLESSDCIKSTNSPIQSLWCDAPTIPGQPGLCTVDIPS
ncbi:hypothetical protein CY34DRAFT_807437 [Suillus luteus UH-Slu-Lm8-n1]|uniref:Uncharacterized protein n=1 Tax=Suillus luteus UH-Slu-Lm8-n1 TaxID=930992 RepID=A0A0D0B116_9AGAM|nr:hypothetical protein CY34DRAFT_807437 [Suillus luteus UH-Slu-Lm8-n1]